MHFIFIPASNELISNITCVIPVVPFDYVMEGILPNSKRLHCSVYTYERGSHALVDGFSEMSGFAKLLVKTINSLLRREGKGGLV